MSEIFETFRKEKQTRTAQVGATRKAQNAGVSC